MRSVEIELGGKTRHLRYTFGAAADIEEKAGASITELFREGRAGLHTFRLLLWGGLKHEDPGLTIQRVDRMVEDYLEQGGRLADLIPKIGEAFRLSGLTGNAETEAEMQ